MNILNWFRRKKNTCIDFGAGYNLTDLPIATFYQGEVKLNFLLDTGSTNNILNVSAIENLSYQETNKTSSVFGMDGIDHVCPYCLVDISYKDTHYPAYFMVCDMKTSFDNIKKETGVTVHGILGSRFFKEYKSILDFAEFKAYFKK